jgi:hypothetical protein
MQPKPDFLGYEIAAAYVAASAAGRCPFFTEPDRL